MSRVLLEKLAFEDISHCIFRDTKTAAHKLECWLFFIVQSSGKQGDRFKQFDLQNYVKVKKLKITKTNLHWSLYTVVVKY